MSHQYRTPLHRQFEVGRAQDLIVADLTYIRMNQDWNYLCVLVNLLNRKIAGDSVDQHKTALLVMSALSQVNKPLSSLCLFHLDRGKAFDNQLFN